MAANQNLAEKQYWLEKMAGEIEKSCFPYDLKRKTPGERRMEILEFQLPTQMCSQLISRGKKQDEALHMILTAGVFFLIYKYTFSPPDEDTKDIILGIPIYKPDNCGKGQFINTFLPIRNQIPAASTFKQLILQVRQAIIGADENSNYPIEILAEQIGKPFAPGDDFPLSDICVLLENIHEKNHIRHINTNLTFRFLRTGTNIEGAVRYNALLYERETIERITNHFFHLLQEVLSDMDTVVSGIDLLSPGEKKGLLYDFNHTQTPYPRHRTIHRLFEEQASLTPHTIALKGPGPLDSHTGAVSYRELNKKANRLGRLLREKGVLPGSIVGILMHRSIEMITAILGILKAGGAYLPIEPGTPSNRTRSMQADCNVSMVLSTRNNAEKDPDGLQDIPDIIMLDEISGKLELQPDDNGEHTCFSSHEPAYIMFTSGSTGSPKGVCTTHYNVIRVVRNTNYINITARDQLLQLSNYAFDGSVFDIYGALLNGASLTMLSQEDVSALDHLAALIKREQVTVLFITTALFNKLVDLDIQCFDNTRKVLFGGEQASITTVAKALEYLGKTRIIHVYGPTETTVYATFYFIDGIHRRAHGVPIGKPISNTSVYILDNDLKPVPIGVTGEVYIGGDGVAKGYLNRPQLTAGKFVENPYNPPGRMYRSGDIGRLTTQREIEFLGRIDHQVKIRGFRIELGEIEGRLLDYAHVKEAVVTMRIDNVGDKRLAAYIAPTIIPFAEVPGENNGEEEWFNAGSFIGDLRSFLKEKLPHYMIPHDFVLLPQLPLTPNGKIDRKALPDPDDSPRYNENNYTAPRGEIEKILAETWEKLLGRDLIGINESFFELGGDSIKSIQVATRLKKAGYRLEVKDLFIYQTISELAPHIKKLEQVADQSTITGHLPLSPIQAWFFNSRFTAPHHFNQAVMFHSTKGFNTEATRAALSKISQHHDALRMVFRKDNQTLIQENRGLDSPFSLQLFDYRNQNRVEAVKALEAKAGEIQAGIDLADGPLMKPALFQLDDGDRLLIVIHHLVIDTVSWRIILEDFETLYRQYTEEQPLELPLKSDSFKSWSEKLSQYADSSTFLMEKSYWRDIEEKVSVVPAIEKDFHHDGNLNEDAAGLSFKLSPGDTGLLLTKANKAFRTRIDDLLLTALGLSIAGTFGHTRVPVTLEGHGREDILNEMDISRTVGWFTTMYPILLDFSHAYYNKDLARQIIEVKETLHRVPNKGIGYGILKYLTAPHHKEDIEFKCKPPISFNYLGQFDSEVNAMSFDIAGESSGHFQSGKNQRDCDLEVSGVITGGQLSISIAFNRKHVKPGTVETLLGNLEDALLELISFCSNQKESRLTPCDLIYKDLPVEILDRLQLQYPIKDIYPLTPIQEGMLFHVLKAPSSSANLQQFCYRLKGKLNIDAVQKTLNQIVERHDILRTAFIYKGLEQPLQIVLKHRTIDFDFIDIRDMPPPDRESCIRRFKEEDIRRSFDLTSGALMRVTVFRLDEYNFEFIWSLHHILLDGWCIKILFSEYQEIYNSYLENRTYRLPGIKPYSNYIRWLEEQDMEASKNYWRHYLEGFEEASTLPKKKTLNPDAGLEEQYRLAEVSASFEIGETQRLNQLAQDCRITLNTLIQSVWGIILSKYNKTKDVVFGAVVSGRPSKIEGIESMIGLFINTIPVRITYEKETTFKELITQVQVQAANSEPHHYFSPPAIQAVSPLKQNLVEHVMVFENYPVEDQINDVVKETREKERSQPLRVSGVSVFSRGSYDFCVLVHPDESLNISLMYNARLYERELPEGISADFKYVIHQVLENENLAVADIILLSAAGTPGTKEPLNIQTAREDLVAEFNI